MEENESKLLDFNYNGALTNLLSAEEHAIGANDISTNSWCQKKHLRLALGHHTLEAIELTSKNNPETSKKLREFKEKVEKREKEGNLTAGELRDFRNEFREITGDKTLSCKDKVCSLDKLSSNSTSLIKDNESTGNPGETNWKPWLLIVGVAIGIVFLVKMTK